MEKQNRHRPLIITVLAIFHFLMGLCASILFLMGGVVMLTMPLTDPRNNLECTRAFGLALIPAGLWVGGFFAYTAWNFYKLKPWTYRYMRSTARSPLYWLVTRFGRRLDDEDVLTAFGLTLASRDSTKPYDM